MFWGWSEWDSCPDNIFPIIPRDPKRYDEAGYRLSIGSEVFLPDADNSEPRQLEKGCTFNINAGQFAFLLTEEVVSIPMDKIALISVRASYKFFGLVNVSGFHVDPGYKGKLIFAVFNSGPKRITLERGEEIFSIWIADLKSPIPPKKAPKKSYYRIDSEIVRKIDGHHLTAYQVDKKIEAVREIAISNQDSLRSYKVYFGIAVVAITLILVPMARESLSIYWDFFSQTSPTDHITN